MYEWWHLHRTLTVYWSPASVQFVRAWGPDIDEEMETGEFAQAADFAGAWGWLTSEPT